jgi:hypothetical protein
MSSIRGLSGLLFTGKSSPDPSSDTELIAQYVDESFAFR